MMNLTPAELALNVVWPALDSMGRTYTSALASAQIHAEGPDALTADDLRALVVGGVVVRKKIRGTETGDRWVAALVRAESELAHDVGYTGKPVQTDPKMPATAAISVVVVLVAAVIEAGIVAWLIYEAAGVVDRELARRAVDRELVRIYAHAQDVADRHEPGAPWTAEELHALTELEAAASGLRKKLGPEPAPGPSVPFGLGTAFGALAVLGGAWYLWKH